VLAPAATAIRIHPDIVSYLSRHVLDRSSVVEDSS
jgi:hypothetical protein